MKIISEVLQPLVGKTKTFVKDGYHFIHLLNSDSMKSKRGFQVSFDTVALFPSIVMSEALNLLEKRIQEDLTLYQRTNLLPSELMTLIRECYEDPCFECELGLFRQTDGTPMGAPLSCILADIFLEDYEEKK